MRINELTDLRTIAILFLFLVHSNLAKKAPILTHEIELWFLSALFFISGYLTFASFHRRKENITNFIVQRLKKIYFPFFIIMIFYLVIFRIQDFTLNGFISSALVLPAFFQVFSEGEYALRHFWFIPILLFFTIFLILLQKYIKKDRIILSIVVLIWLMNLINYIFMSPFRFNWNFGFYIFVFAIGFFISKNTLLNQLQKPRLTTLFLFVSVSIFFLNFLFYPNWQIATEIGRAGYYSFNWIKNTIISISTIIPLLTLLHFFRSRYSGSKIFKISDTLSSITLYIYLLEVIVSTIVTQLIFRTPYSSELTGIDFFLSTIIRIFSVTTIAYLFDRSWKFLFKIITSR